MNDLGKNEETKQLNQDDLPETSDISKPDDEVMPEAVVKPEAKIDTEAMPDAVVKQESEELKDDAPEDDPSADDVSEPDESMESMMDLYEESFKRFTEGEVVTGRIIALDKEFVLVDIGYKSEGQIRISEFKDEEGNVNVNLGDSTEVMVEWWDEDEERVVLSKEKAENI
ncbi:MAG: S1 RNA-binding domain-containing protein, partial [Thermodesulfobacteriota bacterium]|nr:S1 RNA-binding domain-containing protein [Thermodesulfobacteriota bacterium]